MSQTSSPESGSSRRRSADQSGPAPMTAQAREQRYQRAADRAAETAPAELERQRLEAKDSRRSQSERVRDERANRDALLAGRSKQAREIAELLTGKAPAADGSPGAPPRRTGDGGEEPNRDQGARPATTEPLADRRPALESDDDDDDQVAADGPRTIKDFAAEHELSAKELYELSVDMGRDAEPMTIGALKDRVNEMRDFETTRDDFEEDRSRSQNEILVARQQIEDVLLRLKNIVPAQQLAEAFADMTDASDKALEKAGKQLNDWFPEWKDPHKRASDRERLETVLATYGFSKFEVGAVRDARLIKFAMDAIRKADRYDRLKASVTDPNRDKKPSREAPARNQKTPRQNATSQADAMAKSGDKVGAIAALLRG